MEKERAIACSLYWTQDRTLATVRPDGYPQATTVSDVNDGLALYAGVGLDSQKAHNVQQCPKVSLTNNLPYSDWRQIRGISATASAAIRRGEHERERVAAAFIKKFPQVAALLPGGMRAHWGSMLFLRIDPTVISLLDYRNGFGHTELFAVA